MADETMTQIQIVDEMTRGLERRYKTYLETCQAITLSVFKRYANPKPAMLNDYFREQLKNALINYVESYQVQELFNDMADHYTAYGVPPESYIHGFDPPEATTTTEKES